MSYANLENWKYMMLSTKDMEHKNLLKLESGKLKVESGILGLRQISNFKFLFSTFILQLFSLLSTHR
jgi:hypothetical protein